MAGIAQRLQKAMRDGNLRVADLTRWFARPDPTVRGWTKGVEPGGAPQDLRDIERRLAALERLIRNGRYFPFETRLSPADRIKRLQDAVREFS